MTDGRGSRNCLTPRAPRTTSHETTTTTKTAATGRRSESRERSGDLRPRPATGPRGATSAVNASGSSARDPLGADRGDVVVVGRRRALVTSERLANGGHVFEVALVLARIDGPRLRQVDVDDPADPARPRRHDDDAGGQEDRLRDRVRHEDNRRAGLPPDPHELEIEPLPGHLVERAERLVHEEQLRIEGQRSGDRDT